MNGNSKLDFLWPESAGCGFGAHAKASGWKSGVTSSKCSAPVPLAQLDPTLKGCSHSSLGPGRLSWLPGLVLLPRMLEQGCEKGSRGLVSPPSASAFPHQSGLRVAPFIPRAPILAGSWDGSGAGHGHRGDAAAQVQSKKLLWGPVCPSVQKTGESFQTGRL